MKIDIKRIDEAIDIFTEMLPDYKPEGAPSNILQAKYEALKTAITILQHIKQHGLALTEEEIEKVWFSALCNFPINENGYILASRGADFKRAYQKVAKSIHERQVNHE